MPMTKFDDAVESRSQVLVVGFHLYPLRQEQEFGTTVTSVFEIVEQAIQFPVALATYPRTKSH